MNVDTTSRMVRIHNTTIEALRCIHEESDNARIMFLIAFYKKFKDNCDTINEIATDCIKRYPSDHKDGDVHV